ncbi:NAD(P)/FAD-dependent oxidoreductase [Carboxylicivirga sp. M1479]|uniref:NAD(P)/FAD-dependent oxidoreductase n=1 Tax=Carboxylicivirga sp. M1479 TaxID=2594476 RepID=UPI0011779AD2|nr:FAD-dependent oxidoreductase [Carboxylicivirga sp. M1479]TRX66436.1 hypothetical protein FNN09_13040 [Carboxylicivirga sp. M1479]
MSYNNYPIIAVGASITSISFIRTLRSHGDKRKVLLINGEDRLPYKRTKINKNMVRGFDKDEFKIADEKWYSENNVDLIYDRVIDVDQEVKKIRTRNNVEYSYDKLLISTGAVSVIPQISGVEKKEIHGVQNAHDVERVLEKSGTKDRFLIIGGGVEGIETADQLIRKGKKVILASRMKLPLQKLFPPKISATLKDAMLQKGVEFLSGVSVSSIQHIDGAYKVNLQGQVYQFDVIVACTGAVPNIDLGKKAGLEVEHGIVVDEYMQTSNKDILAAGDVAQHARGVVTGLWHAAEHQGALAAYNILKKPQAHTLPPYRLKTEVFGLYLFSGAYEDVVPGVDTEVEEHHGAITRFLYYMDESLKAAVFVNDQERAKTYQKALMERWNKDKVEQELPLPPAMSFSLFSS